MSTIRLMTPAGRSVSLSVEPNYVETTRLGDAIPTRVVGGARFELIVDNWADLVRGAQAIAGPSVTEESLRKAFEDRLSGVARVVMG